MLPTNKRKAKEKLDKRHRNRSRKESFEIYNVLDDGKLSSSLSSPSCLEATTAPSTAENEKAINIVEWRVDGNRVSTLNTLTTFTTTEHHSGTANDPSQRLPTLPKTNHSSLEQMLDDTVHQYGDLLRDPTPEMGGFDKENQGVWQLFRSASLLVLKLSVGSTYPCLDEGDRHIPQ